MAAQANDPKIVNRELQGVLQDFIMFKHHEIFKFKVALELWNLTADRFGIGRASRLVDFGTVLLKVPDAKTGVRWQPVAIKATSLKHFLQTEVPWGTEQKLLSEIVGGADMVCKNSRAYELWQLLMQKLSDEQIARLPQSPAVLYPLARRRLFKEPSEALQIIIDLLSNTDQQITYQMVKEAASHALAKGNKTDDGADSTVVEGEGVLDQLYLQQQAQLQQQPQQLHAQLQQQEEEEQQQQEEQQGKQQQLKKPASSVSSHTSKCSTCLNNCV